MRDLVIYHASCMDGAAAAWVVKQCRPDAEFIPLQYDDAPPDVTDRRIWCLDFSFGREVLLAMKEKAKSLMVLDHHKTVAKDLEGLDFCRFDMEKSGCIIAWEHFFPENKVVPILLRYICDRDIWRWRMPFSREINAAIQSYPHRIESIEELMKRDINQLVDEGKAIIRFRNSLVEDIIKGARETELDGHKILCVYTSVLQSEVGERLAQDRPFSLTWFDLQDGEFCYSLRAVAASGFDVGDIARKHGGGGHALAAGFRSREKFFSSNNQ
jgi:oligoribonuclease NrnB/cAMP/cGMP phosphodiesterase (DHH superfamily)